jgi:hypothetical protein
MVVDEGVTELTEVTYKTRLFYFYCVFNDTYNNLNSTEQKVRMINEYRIQKMLTAT